MKRTTDKNPGTSAPSKAASAPANAAHNAVKEIVRLLARQAARECFDDLQRGSGPITQRNDQRKGEHGQDQGS